VCPAPPNGCRAIQHSIWRIKQEIREAKQWGSGGWEAWACTPPVVLLRCFWGLCSMPRLIFMIFVADLTAIRLIFSWVLWHVDKLLQGCGVGSLCGWCRWCLLLQAGWCWGFYGVRVSEAAFKLFSCLFCLLGRGSVYTVLNSIKCISRLFGCMSSSFIARGTDWQRHLLGYYGQLFLPSWQI